MIEVEFICINYNYSFLCVNIYVCFLKKKKGLYMFMCLDYYNIKLNIWLMLNIVKV